MCNGSSCPQWFWKLNYMDLKQLKRLLAESWGVKVNSDMWSPWENRRDGMLRLSIVRAGIYIFSTILAIYDNFQRKGKIFLKMLISWMQLDQCSPNDQRQEKQIFSNLFWKNVYYQYFSVIWRNVFCPPFSWTRLSAPRLPQLRRALDETRHRVR